MGRTKADAQPGMLASGMLARVQAWGRGRGRIRLIGRDCRGCWRWDLGLQLREVEAAAGRRLLGLVELPSLGLVAMVGQWFPGLAAAAGLAMAAATERGCPVHCPRMQIAHAYAVATQQRRWAHGWLCLGAGAGSVMRLVHCKPRLNG